MDYFFFLLSAICDPLRLSATLAREHHTSWMDELVDSLQRYLDEGIIDGKELARLN